MDQLKKALIDLRGKKEFLKALELVEHALMDGDTLIPLLSWKVQLLCRLHREEAAIPLIHRMFETDLEDSTEVGYVLDALRSWCETIHDISDVDEMKDLSIGTELRKAIGCILSIRSRPDEIHSDPWIDSKQAHVVLRVLQAQLCATRKIASNDFDGALDVLESQLEVDDIELIFMRSTVSILHSQIRNALSDMKQIGQVYQDRVLLYEKATDTQLNALQGAGECLYWDNKFKEALQYFSLVLEETSTFDQISKRVEALVGRAKCLCQLNQSSKAMLDTQNALESIESSESPHLFTETEGEALFTLASLQMKGSPEDQTSVLSSIKRLYAHPNASRYETLSNFFKASVLFSQGKLNEALEDTQKCLQKSPSFLPARELRGNIYMSKSSASKAIEDYSFVLSKSVEQRPQILHGRGLAFLSLNDCDGAINDFSALLDVCPNMPEALECRAWAYSRKGMFSNAIDDLSSVIGKFPKSFLCFFERAKAFLYEGKFEAALADLDNVAQLNPEMLGEVSFLKGVAFLALEQLSSSIHAFSEAIAQNANFVDAIIAKGVVLNLLEKHEQCIHQMESALEKYENIPAHVFFVLGHSLMQCGMYQRAIYQFDTFMSHIARESIEQKMIDDLLSIVFCIPSHYDVNNPFMYRAECLFNLKEYSEASEDLDRALILVVPEDPLCSLNRILNLKGLCSLELGDFNEAMDNFTQSIEEKPLDTRNALQRSKSYLYRGNTLLRLDEWKKAEEDFEIALQLNPNETDAMYSLGRLWFSQQRWEESKALFSRVLHCNEDYYEAFCYRGAIQVLLDQPEDAAADFEQALTLNPSSYDAMLWKSKLLLNEGKIDDAIVLLSSAISQHPNLPEAYCDRGLAFNMQNKSNEAKVDFETALSLKTSAGRRRSVKDLLRTMSVDFTAKPKTESPVVLNDCGPAESISEGNESIEEE